MVYEYNCKVRSTIYSVPLYSVNYDARTIEQGGIVRGAAGVQPARLRG